MKKIKIGVLVLLAVGIFTFNMSFFEKDSDISDIELSKLISQAAASDSEGGGGGEKAGKWVPVFSGHSTPVSCKCTDSTWTGKCLVGDITTDISKCS